MKIRFIFFLLFTNIALHNLYAQNINLSVTYKITTTGTKNQPKNYSDTKTNKTVNEVLNGVAKNLDLIEFIMYCNSSSSIYYLIEKLEINEDLTYKIASRLGGSGIYYKNMTTKTKLNQKDALGEKINVIYDYDEYKWKITQETKLINGYKCLKATALKEEYDYLNKTKKVMNSEVWFTPEISVPFGPKGFDGLPGLVLEATNNGKTFIYATKIDFEPDNINDILKKPRGGKDMEKDQYLKILAAKLND